MARGRLIVSVVLVATFCASIVALAIDMRPNLVASRVPEIDVIAPGVASAEPASGGTRAGGPLFPGEFPNTMAPRAVPGVANELPASVLNLTDWKLTLPTGDDEPQEVTQPDLSRFRDEKYFHNDATGGAVVFRAPTGGTTTENSSYPRSELREMADGGKEEASWSGDSGTHTMTIAQAITAVPTSKPHVVAGQIHDEEDDVVMVRLEGQRLFVEADGDDIGTLDPAYRLGTRFTVQFVVADEVIRVIYNGSKTVGLKHSGSGYYFKAGCYTQSDEDGDSYGEVVISALTVQHTG